MMATGMASVKAVVSLVATVSDDGSELTCLARNNLISDHDKPKFNNYINFIQLDEHESRQLDVMVRANPSVDNLVFNRVKETTSQSASRTNVTQYQQRVTILDDLIDDYANISWMVEPMPTHWSFILTGDQIRLNIVNVTAIDSGLYMARVSNTLGDSVFFTRIHVKTLSSIKSIRISSSSSTSSASLASSSNQTTSTIREGDAYFTIECQVNANPSIAIQWTKQYSMNHWDLSRSRSSFNDTEPYFNNGPLFVNEDESIDSNAIDWNRSNVSQTQPFYGGSDLSAQLIVSRLTIGNVRFTDSGVYSCITPNDTRTIQVNIEHRPRIMAGFGSPIVATDYGSSVSAVKFYQHFLTYNSIGRLMIQRKQRSIKIGSNSKYQLMTRNGQLGSHRSSDQSDNQHFTSELIIHHITEQDYGQYQCEAYNRFGSDQSMFELVRKRHPETPKNIQVINVTQNSAFLTWRPGFDYGHDQQYQLTLWHLSEEHRKQIEANKYDESDESMFEHLPSRTYPNMTVSHLLLSNLEPNTYYRVSLISFNRLGQSDRSVSTIIHTSTKSANYVHDKTAIPIGTTFERFKRGKCYHGRRIY
ncbi:heterophilic cell-cell adhesion via plasma membrane cell adhesion molecule [Blomia tropicalis]|nr:heterophilic cell-cell adhesion via plasma membrane cell adhesion molecule [Blomia tropicalis]